MTPVPPGWQTFLGTFLALGGIFAVVDGLMAVYRSSFFAGNAVFVFSDLRTWGWITFGLGALGIAAGLAVFSGREWARWTGIIVASLAPSASCCSPRRTRCGRS